MTIKLNSYRPLCISEQGREAIKKYGFPPFIDSSCRRDPDLENEYPSTTALCRGENFAPKVNVGDIIVYMTRKGDYGIYSDNQKTRVLTAVLEVVEIYKNHEEAARWYEEHGVKLPNNCIVPGNPPYEWDQTAGINGKDFKNVKDWDAFYRERTEKIPVFVRCRKLYCNIENPPFLSNDQLYSIFGRVPSTQTPPAISADHFEKLMKLLNIEVKLPSEPE